MDDHTLEHFQAWLNRHVRPEEHLSVFDAIVGLLKDDPDLLNDHSWSQLRDMAGAW